MASSTLVDISAGPRAVVGTAAELIYKVGRSVLGSERMPTAKANAWAAVCADQERARIREEDARVLLAAG
ncbi:hypothetical protein AB0M46_17025 [Dactylosporangium sp. NPDC051485]|uniref:hypothetical protein n=1 Tax=Dactylosporangium sp. NPDC051485 TaxID=3154846 RepID=UPI0034232B00